MRAISPVAAVLFAVRQTATVLLVLATVAVPSFGQPATVEHVEDFQSWGTQANPPGWVDSSVGRPAPEAKGLFKTWPDPANGNNVVFGTRQASGKAEKSPPRIGSFSTFVPKAFHASGRFEFRGRILRTTDEARIGLTFFSAYPDDDRYYLIALWSRPEGAEPTLQLFATGGGQPSGVLDSGYTPRANEWVRFLIQAEERNGATAIRARFWPESVEEPASFQIEAVDAASGRLVSGRIGLWAAVRGEAYFDDLHARSPVDHTAPVIEILESGAPLVDGAGYDRPVMPVISVTDDLSEFIVEVELDGAPWTDGTAIATDGPHLIEVVATDAAGNRGVASASFFIDQTAPVLRILAPAPGACSSAESLALSGTLFEPHLASMTVSSSVGTIPATVDPISGSWSAVVTLPEGRQSLAVEATDIFGHRSIAPLPLLVDRQSPSIEILADGAPAENGTVVNRALTMSGAVSDLDRGVALRLLLDGSPLDSPSMVSDEGSHVLSAAATDCAGNSAQRSISFTIDRTAPAFGAFDPPVDATVGTMRTSISGEVAADATSVSIAGTALSATPAVGRFTIEGVQFVEGLNRFLLRARDSAGNESEFEYRVTLRTGAPSLEILESGVPLAPGSLFNREIRPEIRSGETTETLVVSLDGSPFTAGSFVSSEGAHLLEATATDDLGHEAHLAVSFIIDRMPPAVTIQSPAEGSIAGERVTVSGTATDAVWVGVNGVEAALQSGTFMADVALEDGETLLVATARDAAGNSGRAEVVVTREMAGSGVIITAPVDGMLTNRPTVRVTGRVLSPSRVNSLLAGSISIPIDAAGQFAIEAWPLAEGTNEIRVTAESTNGETRAAVVSVIADRTPPVLQVLEGGSPMDDAVRVASPAIISLSASDDRELQHAEARIDGVLEGMPATVNAAGGHVIVAVARDAAGNEIRIERAFIIGGAPTLCRLDGFVPSSGSVIGQASARLTGRTGGASGVTVNGMPATVVDGSFCATVELPSEGRNELTVACTTVEGEVIGLPATVELFRATQIADLIIETPREGYPTRDEMLTVEGTAGPGLVEVTVNGRVASLSQGDASGVRRFTVQGIRLAPGLNVVVARGQTASRRQASTSRRVLFLRDPASLTIRTPSIGAEIGRGMTSVSGIYRGIDPASLAISGSAAAAEVRPFGDDEGAFVFRDVILQPGENAIAVTGVDSIGDSVSSSVIVRRNDTRPSIEIVQPHDASYAGIGESTISVSGHALAAAGATVEVSGRPATIVATETVSSGRMSYQFQATVTLASSGLTPIVARVIEPSGDSASHAVRVTRFEQAPEVERVFPDNLAVAVDPGAMIVALFSLPMSPGTVRGAFHLESGAGSPVSGVLRADRDAITFAPSMPLEGGEYRVRIDRSATDASGEPLGREVVSTFRVASEAPAFGPSLDPLSPSACDEPITISGTAEPGARLRVEIGQLALTASADGGGRFSVQAPTTGARGYQLIKVQSIGAEGTLSPATFACLLSRCGGLAVVSARYDRSTNGLTVIFSGDLDASTIDLGEGGSIRLQRMDGSPIGGSVSVEGSVATILPSPDLSETSFTLQVTTAVRGSDGAPLRRPHVQTFTPAGEAPPPTDGSGFVAGEVLDASTGRPLPGAGVYLHEPAPVLANGIRSPAALPSSTTVAAVSDARGRYALRLTEGPHSLQLSADGYVSVWRQVIVTAGQGVTPIDIRLTPRELAIGVSGSANLEVAADAIRAAATLAIPAGGIAEGTHVSFTSLGAQSLTGLLPLGWSPLASAEIWTEDPAVALTALLSFHIGEGVPAPGAPLTLVRYEPGRDEWRVISAVVNVVDGMATAAVAATGTYALVAFDPGVPHANPTAGGSLQARPDPCATEICVLSAIGFSLDPATVLPDQPSVATLRIDGSIPFPAGTAVQVWIDEELRLSDGSLLLDPPFAADLILYRSLSDSEATAAFAIAPSRRAAEVILESGVDRLKVMPYPGRLARGALVGPEGGRIPGDGDVVVEIPAGATAAALRAASASLTASELTAFSVPGFRLLAGFTLELARAAGETSPDLDGDGSPDSGPVELTTSARVTFPLVVPELPQNEVILGEVVDDAVHGRIVRLAARTSRTPLQASEGWLITTRVIDRAVLPLDGVVREGAYLLLAAESPIAFATGTVGRGAVAPYVSEVVIGAPSLGARDRTRITGVFAVPVPASPAAPFSLSARHARMGEGTVYQSATSPAPGEVVSLGALTLVPESPRVVSTTPPASAIDVSLGSEVRVQFDRAIDAVSIEADTISVTDSGSGRQVAGMTQPEGETAVRWTPSESLQPGLGYDVVVSAGMRAATGAPLGAPYAFSFTTMGRLVTGGIDPDLISITIPSEGVSVIRGSAEAIPAGWQAVAVRRGRAFVVRPQGTAEGDGSFSFNAGSAADPVTIRDILDLHLFNEGGTLSAIIPLTPFIGADGVSFISSPGSSSRFTTSENVTVTIPAGAFDEPTLVRATVAAKDTLHGVPDLDTVVRWAAAVRLTLDCAGGEEALAVPCVAKERIEIEMPAAGADPDGEHILALLGHSVRGPRLMAVDTLRVDGGRFKTAFREERSSIAGGTQFSVTPHAVLTDAEVKSHLLGVNRSGIYSVVGVNVPEGALTWGVIEGLQLAVDLFCDTLASFYAAHFYLAEARGRIVIPMVAGVPFKVTGVDAATGLTAFEKIYDPMPPGNPGEGTVVESPLADVQGPYPLFATPFRIEVLDLDAEGVDIHAVPNFRIRLENGLVNVFDAGPAVPLAIPVTLLNVTQGTSDSVRSDGLTVSGKKGDRMLLVIGSRDVDPQGSISVVFSEPLDLGGAVTEETVDAFLRTKMKVHKALGSAAPEDVTSLFRFRTESGGRRIVVEGTASLHRGATYRLFLSKQLADPSGLKLGEVIVAGKTKGGLGADLVLELTTRPPGGVLGSLELTGGSIRDLARSGNVLFVSALEGGLRAFDVSNPEAMTPLGGVPGTIDHYWTAAVDDHGRVFATGMGSTFGVLRSFRTEHFMPAVEGPMPEVTDPVGSGMVSWVPGYANALGLVATTVLSDRPEAIPRKLQVLTQDVTLGPFQRDAFKTGAGVSVVAAGENVGAFEQWTVTAAWDPQLPYSVQRLTLENVDAGLRWSADARPGHAAVLHGVVARSTDRLRLVRNQRTYGVLSLFGYGIALLDLNAMESNDAEVKPAGYEALREHVLMTRARLEEVACGHPPLESGAIPDLGLSPQAAILAHPSQPRLRLYALDSKRGVLDLTVTPAAIDDGVGTATDGPFCGRGPIGMLFQSPEGSPPGDSRLQALRAKFQILSGRQPAGRFNVIATHRWRIEAEQNRAVVIGGPGQRGTVAGQPAERDYLLVAGHEYGLLVVEAPRAGFLGPQHLADVLWVPAGVASVRTIPGSPLALLVDGVGHLLLADLARLDERWDRFGVPLVGGALFPSVDAALAGSSGEGVGRPDPRIVWRSADPVASGTLSPLVDPLTGIVLAGQLLGSELTALSAIDPRLRVVIDGGN